MPETSTRSRARWAWLDRVLHSESASELAERSERTSTAAVTALGRPAAVAWQVIPILMIVAGLALDALRGRAPNTTGDGVTE